MQTKMTLHGAGVYYFSVYGAKDQPIFQSVFEFEYGRQLLSAIPDTRLMAYVLEEKRLQFVMRCSRDWTGVMDDIQTAFDNMHERCWHKRRQILSDQGVVLMVDEQTHLTDLILQLHDWPRRSGLVASADLWPWSSDHQYRMDHPPAWIDTESMLNLLSHSRRNRAQHYIDVMHKPITSQLDLEHGNHPLYQALARDHWVDQHMKKEALTQSAYREEDILRLFSDACELVARQFDITIDELKDKLHRRRYHNLMPLVVWLLRERGITLEAIAPLLDEEEDRLQLWLRNVVADHTDNVRHKLHNLWAPDNSGLGSGNALMARHTDSPAPTTTQTPSADEAQTPGGDSAESDAVKAETPETTDPQASGQVVNLHS